MAYGLLGGDALGVGGHGLRGLDLLLDDGRHLFGSASFSPSLLSCLSIYLELICVFVVDFEVRCCGVLVCRCEERMESAVRFLDFVRWSGEVEKGKPSSFRVELCCAELIAEWTPLFCTTGSDLLLRYAQLRKWSD
jgi:hypothetical protein